MGKNKKRREREEQRHEFDKDKSVIGTNKFIDWLCSKEEILTEPITPIKEYNL